jgi:hypothetical protein
LEVFLFPEFELLEGGLYVDCSFDSGALTLTKTQEPEERVKEPETIELSSLSMSKVDCEKLKLKEVKKIAMINMYLKMSRIKMLDLSVPFY